MFRFARSILGSPHDAEDVVSTLLECLWRERSRLDGISNVEGYVIRAVRNCSIDYMRRKSPGVDVDTLSIEYDDEGQRDTLQMVQFAISRLSERHRTVIHLKDIEGYSNDEIAEIIGGESSSVRMILSRARAALREEIVRNEQLVFRNYRH